MQPSVVVCSVLASREFESSLSLALGPNIKFVSEPFDVIPGDSTPSLLVGIYAKGSETEQLAFDEWAQGTQTTNLAVEIGRDEVVVGPLTLPGRGGCGYCARARRAAASPLQERNGRPAERGAINFPPAAAQMLADEIHKLAWDHPQDVATLTEVLIWNSQTRVASRRSLVPLPWCRVCGGAGRGAQRKEFGIKLSADQEPELVLHALSGLVDANVGIVSSIQFELPEDGKEVPIIATAAPPHLLRDDGSLRRLPLGWGKV